MLLNGVGERETGTVDLLEGVIDVHVHAAPDVRERKLTMLDAARQTAGRRMAGMVLKSHHEPTEGRAAAVSRPVAGVGVYGGVVLNRYVDGRLSEAGALTGPVDDANTPVP